jgi:hypothetical protein
MLKRLKVLSIANKVKLFTNRHLKNRFRVFGIFSVVLVLFSIQQVAAFSEQDFQCTVQGDNGGTCFYNPDACGAGSSSTGSSDTGSDTGSSDTSGSDTGSDTGSGCGGSCSVGTISDLTGSDNEDKTWNFFKEQGLSDAQAAGIMGNLDQESSFVPDRVQGGANESTTNDPTTVSPSDYGFGIAQWDADAFNGYIQSNKISGADASLATQLNLIITQLKGGDTPYQGVPNELQVIKAINDPQTVAAYFENHFEGGTDPGGSGPAPTDAGPGGNRENDALAILKMYGGSGGVTSTNPITGGCSSSGGSVDCTSATGDSKILCEAEQWKGIYYFYGGGHDSLSDFVKACPNLANPPDNQAHGRLASDGYSGNPSPCAVDCSGLVDIATDMAFSGEGVSMDGDKVAGIQQNPYWKRISMSSVQPGDIVTEASEHTEIVDSYTPGSDTIMTFGAHETGQQDGEIPYPISFWTGGAFRYVGPGSNASN